MNQLTQRDAIDKLHGDEMHGLIVADLIDVRDIRMIEGRRGHCFLFEPAHAITMRGEFRR